MIRIIRLSSFKRFDRLIDGKIKRLASLEFEEKSYPYPIKVPNLCIDANTTLLNIHVCSNADLTPEEAPFMWHYTPNIPVVFTY